ncbi:AAA family ATPase [Spirulina sp. CCNP1310]|uniref:AAA family ATPase n=1 Tax=Spirulina sp. CCNP1310 TaxID=3110249 RepID=UPI002B1F2BF9|nr:AAA family ATPase [Spirulina sp. CCNP1310]MEA5420547.1 AAA family ATPase [Spirulina sp. CCNP1310]
MKLVWFELHGYKRFKESVKLNVDGKLVALVGENEVGKTSILKAMQSMNYNSRFTQGDVIQDITRDYDFEEQHDVLKATFWIEQEDKDYARDILFIEKLKWIELAKKKQGEKETKFFFEKDIEKYAFSWIYSFTECTLKSLETKQSLGTYNIKKDISSFIDQLKLFEKKEDKDNKELKDLIENLQESALIIHNNFLLNDQDPKGNSRIKFLESLINATEAILAIRRGNYPHLEKQKKLLEDRIPEFLFFTEQDRDLQYKYDISTYFSKENNPAIPRSLKNLESALNLSLKGLFEAAQKNNQAKIEDLLEHANLNLKNLLNESWSQSSLTAKLIFNKTEIQILLKSDKGGHTILAERSDGLKSFFTLMLFLSQKKDLKVKPIILIDEIESRLHYDAQADVVQMLARQELASKVIYTTHSIGCLPEDLGNGVRLIKSDGNHSKIENYFWQEQEDVGFTPLLFGMGAKTLAFIPVRCALITEGPTDMLLLPALLKEYLRQEVLGFQVVPGLSEASDNQIRLLGSQGKKTAYLVDGDEAGTKIASQLRSSGVPDEKIIILPQVNQQNSILEDYIDIDSYVHAVNIELQRSHGTSKQITSSDVELPNRYRKLDDWCKIQGIKPLSEKKRAIAYHLLEHRYDYPLYNQDASDSLKELYEKICKALEA